MGTTSHPPKVKMTPMLQQYFDLKKRCPDAVLFFRMGDFFEIFGEDAQTCLLYTSPSPRDVEESRMPSSA